MQQVWYNKFIIVNKKPITKMFPCQLFIADLFHQNKLIDWQNFKEKSNLSQKDYFRWRQIVTAIPKSWKKLITSEVSKTQHTILLTKRLAEFQGKIKFVPKILFQMEANCRCYSKIVEKDDCRK